MDVGVGAVRVGGTVGDGLGLLKAFSGCPAWVKEGPWGFAQHLTVRGNMYSVYVGRVGASEN
jgi:hypothetical protein